MLDTESNPKEMLMGQNDRFNLLIDVMNLFSQMVVPCQKINAKTHKETSTCTINATVLLTNTTKMQDLFNSLINIEGVYEVKRVTK